MKTSNKLLIIGFALILIGTFFIIYKVRTFLNFYTSDEVVHVRDLKLSGETIEKTYQLESFSNIRIDGGIKATLFKGDENKLTLEGDSSLISYVEVDEFNDQLVVKLTKVKGKRIRVKADIYTTSFAINDISVNAGGALESIEAIEVEGLKIDVNAGGHTSLNLKCKRVNCNSNAGAHANLKGSTDELEASANAGAYIDAEELQALKVGAKANAGGQVKVYASKKLDANCVAGGSISYAGNPDKVNKTTVAGGRISRID